MEISSALLLEIYDSAQHLSAPCFDEYFLTKLKRYVQFQSAVVADFCFSPEMKMSVGTVYLHGTSKEKILDRPKAMGTEKIASDGNLSSRDFVLSRALKKRNKSVIADLTTITDEGIADYCRRYETFHSLTFASNTTQTGMVPVVALWRATKRHTYAKEHGCFTDAALPHILQAREINRRLVSTSPSQGTNSLLALANQDGSLAFVSNEIVRVLQLEWAQWEPPFLPHSLIDSLRKTKDKIFVGRSIRVKASTQRDMISLVITVENSDNAKLTEAEYRVALLAIKGLQYKEIATLCCVSAATIRNQLHSVYKKLSVSNKTELAAALAL